MARLWKIYTAAAFVAVGSYFVIPSAAADLAYIAIGSSCVVAIMLGIALHKPSSPLPWYLMAAGQAAWVAGDVTYIIEQNSPEGVTFPAPSDIAYLTSYPLIAFAVLLLIRAQHRSRDLAGLVDGLIVAVGIGLMSWALIAGPILGDPTMSRLGSIVAAAYPAGDIVILALLLRLMTGQNEWTPSFRLLVGATLTILVADTGFAVSPTDPSYVAFLDLLWLSSYALWGAAALHPDMVNLTTPAVRHSARFTRLRLIILGCVVMMPVALLVARQTLGFDVGLVTLVVGAAVLSLLVMARMAFDIEEIRLTTQQRDDLQDDLFRRATEDEVTGLANRRSFVRLADFALERGVRDNTRSALFVIKVSGVDPRRHGDSHGDEMLGQVAKRIRDVTDPDDLLGRVGPQQFGILVELEPETDLGQIAEDLLAACKAPISIKGQSVSLAAAAGIVVSPEGSIDPETLIHEAALAAGSTAGGGDVRFFDATLRAEVLHRNEIEAGLLQALDAGHLEVHYQPILSVETAVLGGYEALIRWNRPGHGILFPDSFIPLAEKSDLICDLDRWVLREATRQLAAWTQADPRQCSGLTVAVNVSGRHLASATIVDDVADALRLSGLNPAQLTLEITETVLVDIPTAIQQMSALRQLGVRISIDDFGTGYTSIGQLGQLPADIIKVDRSLVASDKSGARELLALIVHAGHESGLRVLAEGIERPDQLATVTDLGYDSAQGYMIGRAQPARDDEHPTLRLEASTPP